MIWIGRTDGKLAGIGCHNLTNSIFVQENDEACVEISMETVVSVNIFQFDVRKKNYKTIVQNLELNFPQICYIETRLQNRHEHRKSKQIIKHNAQLGTGHKLRQPFLKRVLTQDIAGTALIDKLKYHRQILTKFTNNQVNMPTKNI